MQAPAPLALEQQPPATVVPSAASLEVGRRFLAAGRRVFRRGCKCPLRWDGEVVRPALPCDLDAAAPNCPLDDSPEPAR